MRAAVLDRSLTAQILGKARLGMPESDFIQIQRWIDTASPEANAAMALWDSQGCGFTLETVAYDIANFAARAIRDARSVPGRARGPVECTARVTIGDWLVTLGVVQEDKRGDIGVGIFGAEPRDPIEDVPLVRAFLQAGKPVLVFGADGRMVDLGAAGMPGPADV